MRREGVYLVRIRQRNLSLPRQLQPEKQLLEHVQWLAESQSLCGEIGVRCGPCAHSDAELATSVRCLVRLHSHPLSLSLASRFEAQKAFAEVCLGAMEASEVDVGADAAFGT